MALPGVSGYSDAKSGGLRTVEQAVYLAVPRAGNGDAVSRKQPLACGPVRYGRVSRAGSIRSL